MRKNLLSKAALIAILGLASCQVSLASTADTISTKKVTWEDIANDQDTPENVLMYGMGNKAQRYSPLTEINTETVKDLVPVWNYSFGGEKQRGQESQALVHDGIIYVTGSYSRLFALDAKTGKRIWEYNHRLPAEIRPCCDVVNRGAAIFGDKVFFGTLDAGIVALNKDTGKVVWKKKFGWRYRNIKAEEYNSFKRLVLEIALDVNDLHIWNVSENMKVLDFGYFECLLSRHNWERNHYCSTSYTYSTSHTYYNTSDNT